MHLGGRIAETRASAALRLRELFEIDDGGPVGGEAARPAGGGDGIRVALDRRALAALLVIAFGALVLAGAVVLRSRPHVTPVPAATVLATGAPIPAGPAAPAEQPIGVPGTVGTAPPGAPALLVVDVQGRVRHPGVVRLPAGSRVMDALAAAGGPRPGTATSSLNLAEPLSDGQQIVLGAETPVAAAGGEGHVAASGSRAVGGGPGPSGGLVDLNTATLADLDGLPGVGPVLAQRILDWRQEHGHFTSIEELQEVPGIGPSKFADMKAHVRV